ncbi:conjugal transfer protein [Kocuria sp. cx-455]|uniref:conjugal transfer protein n=1 Tax=Kocuria sp. cx-455 TaxID=2771377 RepID=UPI0016896BD7|nr:conjugal transfer protein [Kocuria sp. cx-455]MBD2766252.1 conjugal transfer protein [Kocuria sp. cx-455]
MRFRNDTEGERLTRKKKPSRLREKSAKPDAGSTATAVQAKSLPMGRVLFFIVVGFLVLGALCGILSLLRPTHVQAAPETTGPSVVEQQEQAFAANFVGAWLNATTKNTKDLDRYYEGAGRSITATAPVEYRDLAVASTQPNDQGSTTVIVSATVKQAPETDGEESKDSDDSATTWVPQYYQVAVAERNGAMSALSLPAPVQQPGIEGAPALAYGDRVNVEKVNDTVEQFLNAYAAGQGDVSRYVSPDSNITSITHSPFKKVTVSSITAETAPPSDPPNDGTKTPVMVTAEMETSAGKRSAQYVLTLEGRDGRWEIDSIDPAPQIKPQG